MIYSSNKLRIQAVQYGVDEIPDWLKPHCKAVGNRLRITQPENNTDLAVGDEYASLCEFIVRTKGNSFQIWTKDAFIDRFIHREAEDFQIRTSVKLIDEEDYPPYRHYRTRQLFKEAIESVNDVYQMAVTDMAPNTELTIRVLQHEELMYQIRIVKPDSEHMFLYREV